MLLPIHRKIPQITAVRGLPKTRIVDCVDSRHLSGYPTPTPCRMKWWAKMNCPECERLWATYNYILKELYRMLLVFELTGSREGLRDMEDSRFLVRRALREHALTHCGEEPEEGGQKTETAP